MLLLLPGSGRFFDVVCLNATAGTLHPMKLGWARWKDDTSSLMLMVLDFQNSSRGGYRVSSNLGLIQNWRQLSHAEIQKNQTWG
jgi:hypothetical protein